MEKGRGDAFVLHIENLEQAAADGILMRSVLGIKLRSQ
jgi:hypothetical protein